MSAMSCHEYSERMQGRFPEVSRQESQNQSSMKEMFTHYKIRYESTLETQRPKLTSNLLVYFDSTRFSMSNLGILWKSHFIGTHQYDNVSNNLKQELVSNIGHYATGFAIEDVKFLAQTDKALDFLNRRIETLTEGIFYNLRSIPPNRAPGYVIDGWIIIPEYDKDTEYKIYKELGSVIRDNTNLLFSIHIIARKGRDLGKIIPRDYKRYNPWSDYVC